MNNNDTIAAISTPLGEGGIGIVRMSGEKALTIIDQIFVGRVVPSQVPSHTVHYGHIVDPQTHQVIDEVLLTVMRAPKTYTREDMVEISGHGGILPLGQILRAVLDGGARLAKPGEFTKRAFLNGRIDLTQAEAVVELIRSKTELELKVAVNHLQGGLSRKVKEMREKLLQIEAYLERAIDFPEEEMELPQKSLTLTLCREEICELQNLLETVNDGRILRDGVKVAIVGRPNVGKSSLFNALLSKDRAIVTHIPGTTRDVLEEWLNWEGIPVRLSDTAGVRETTDIVEIEGVRRTQDAIEDADLLLVVLDASEELKEEDFTTLEMSLQKNSVIVLNKIDLKKKINFSPFTPELAEHPQVEISATLGLGLEKLRSILRSLICNGKHMSFSQNLVTNIRHAEALKRTLSSLENACQTVEDGLSEEFTALEIREALQALGEITGETTTEEILEKIFSQFCIGK